MKKNCLHISSTSFQALTSNLATILCAMMIFSLPAVSRAATISQTLSFNGQHLLSTGDSPAAIEGQTVLDLVCQPFDTSLGSLLSATVTLDMSMTVSGRWLTRGELAARGVSNVYRVRATANGYAAWGFSMGGESLNRRIGNSTSSEPIYIWGGVTTGKSAPDGEEYSGSLHSETIFTYPDYTFNVDSPANEISASALSLLTGSTPFQFTLSGRTSIYGQYYHNISASHSAGNVRIDYEYDPVPEPSSSLTLMLGGVVCLFRKGRSPHSNKGNK